MNNQRRLFLELVKRRASKYKGRRKTIIERKIDKLLNHDHVLIESVADVTKHLDVPYAIVGGHAIAIHGNPRMTEDIDIITKPEFVSKIVKILGLEVSEKLTIGGVAATTPSGIEIDIIAPGFDWVDGLLANADDSKYGKVVSKPYLIVTKIWASRGTQDDADIINTMKKMNDEEKETALKLVNSYFPNASEDVESMIEISKYDLEF